MPSFRGSSWSRDQTPVACIAGRIFTAEPPGKPMYMCVCIHIYVCIPILECICSEWVKVAVVSDSLWPHGLYSPRNSPGQNTGVGRLSLLQGIFPTQGSNPGLPHCRWILYQLSHKEGQLSNWETICFKETLLGAVMKYFPRCSSGPIAGKTGSS